MMDDKLEYDTRTKLIEMLGEKGNVNPSVRSHFHQFIMNDGKINTSLEKILKKLEQQFKITDEMERSRTKNEINNLKIAETTAETLDKIENLRTRAGKSMQLGKEEVRDDIVDRWLIDAVIQQSKERGRMTEYQEDEMKRFCQEHEYRWEEVREKLEKTLVNKERMKGYVETGYA